MKENNKVPKIRFPEFTDAWKQCRLGDVLVERNEKYLHSPIYPLMAFVGNKGIVPKGERFDRSALVNDRDNKLYKRTEIGDFIYSSNNLETGSIGLNMYGNASISPVYSIFKSLSTSNFDFLGRILIKKDFIGKMVRFRQGVVYGQWKIHESDFLKLNVALPTLPEQTKIGDFFTRIDHLIALHQRKLENLEKRKKGLLQNMFPNNDEKVPKIRFPEFDGEWRKCRLGDVLQVNSGRDYKHLKEGNIPVFGTGGYMLSVDSKLSDENAIGIGRKGTIDKPQLLTAPFWTVDTLFFLTVKGNNDLLFLFTLMNIINWKKMDESSGVPSLSKSTIETVYIKIPRIEEQKKIGKCFLDLKEEIIVNQTKLQHLKLLKKGLLQQMFV